MEAIYEVFDKIREMSRRTMSPRPMIMLTDLTGELPSIPLHEYLLPALNQLKRLRLIEYRNTGSQYVKLTLLGHNLR